MKPEHHFVQFLCRAYLGNPWAQYYAFTISPHEKYAEKAVSAIAVEHMFKVYNGMIAAIYVFEKSEKGKWHIHGILASADKKKWVKLCKHPLVHYKLTEYVPGEWIDYCLKGKPDKLYYINKHGQHRCPHINLDWYIEMDE